jgi:hypothetical protein
MAPVEREVGRADNDPYVVARAAKHPSDALGDTRHPYRARVAKASSTLNQPVVRMLSRLPERANSPKNADGRDRDARQLQQNTNKTEDDGPRVHRSDDTRPPGPPVAQLAGEPGSRATARSQGHESRMDER